jgi:hypothetical protein
LVWFRIENIGYTSCNCLFWVMAYTYTSPTYLFHWQKIGSRILIVVVQLW